MKLSADTLNRSGWADPQAASKLYDALGKLGVQGHYAELAIRQGPLAVAHLVEHRSEKSDEWASQARQLIRGGAKAGALPAHVGAEPGNSGRFQLDLFSGKVDEPGKPAPILFYLKGEEYGAFSNFAETPFTVPEPKTAETLRSPTSEHFFQAMKFWTSDPGYAREILAARSPKEAAAFGRNRQKPMRKDWEAIKDDAMRIALVQKFSQDEQIRAVLLGTGKAPIVEHAPHDLYWGNAWELGDIGKNMLGKILEEVRDVLKSRDDRAADAYLFRAMKSVFDLGRA